MDKVVTIPYTPREHFLGFHNRETRWSCIVAHRRAGKTVAVVNDLIKSALTCPLNNPRVAYIAPYYAQAKSVAWDYAKEFSAPIPGVKFNESELKITYPNGATLRLFGADNYDALRGLYLDAVALDEMADFPPDAWPKVIRPALSDRRGSAVFIGTPKGRLNEFFKIHQRASKDADWFDLVLRASESGILPADELESARVEMGADAYAQEYECSFDAAIRGAYFAPLIADAQRQGRISKVAIDPVIQKRAYWDLGIGKGDATVIWVAQFVGHEVRILDHYKAISQPLSEHVAWLRERGHSAALCVLPHDGAHADRVTGKGFDSHVRDAGFSVETVKNQGAGAARKRIEAARRILPSCWFNADACDAGIQELSHYHEKICPKTGAMQGPEHDWSSHSADAFGMLAIDYKIPMKAQAITYRSRAFA